MLEVNQVFTKFPKTLSDFAVRLNMFTVKFHDGLHNDMDVLHESSTFFVMNYLLCDLRKGKYRKDIIAGSEAWLHFCEAVDNYGVQMVIIGNTVYNAILKMVRIFNKEYDKGTLTNKDLATATEAARKFMIASGVCNARPTTITWPQPNGA